jgi:endonuclease/exonuclease/phosphatase family metal-dependent hydrolase
MKRFILIVCLCLSLAGCCVVNSGKCCCSSDSAPLSIMTYNIHTGKGIDGEFSLERISDIIKIADLVGLQELDRNTKRNPVDEPARLEALTGLNSAFLKNLDYQGGEYGIAILSRYPILERRSYSFRKIENAEPRGALAVRVIPEGMESLWFITTHLGTDKTGKEQLDQIKELLIWIGELKKTGDVIITGDFNIEPDFEGIKVLRNDYVDLWNQKGKGPGYTFSAKKVVKRIDYIFVMKEILQKCISIEVKESPASDHYALGSEIILK